MHQRAEFGVAAHWKYKDRVNGEDVGAGPHDDTDMAWLAHITDWQAETSDPGEFLDSLRFEIGAKEVYVFTPQGKVIGLPAGATPVDFAYAVHTEVGHRTMGAKVNGRLVPLESALTSGDVGRGLHLEEPGCGAQPGLAELRQEHAGAQQDPRSGSPRSAATRRSSRARTRSPAPCASRTCRCRS